MYSTCDFIIRERATKKRKREKNTEKKMGETEGFWECKEGSDDMYK